MHQKIMPGKIAVFPIACEGTLGGWDSMFSSRSDRGLSKKPGNVSVQKCHSHVWGDSEERNRILVPTDTIPGQNYENLPHLEAIFFFNVCFVHLGKTLISPPALVLLIKLGFLLFNSSPPSVRWASQTFLMKPPAPGVSQPRGSCCHFLVPAKSAQPLQKTACFYCISDMKTVGFFFALTFSSSFYENVSGLNFSMGIQA